MTLKPRYVYRVKVYDENEKGVYDTFTLNNTSYEDKDVYPMKDLFTIEDSTSLDLAKTPYWDLHPQDISEGVIEVQEVCSLDEFQERFPEVFI